MSADLSELSLASCFAAITTRETAAWKPAFALTLGVSERAKRCERGCAWKMEGSERINREGRRKEWVIEREKHVCRGEEARRVAS